jgi:hypothetical protein
MVVQKALMPTVTMGEVRERLYQAVVTRPSDTPSTVTLTKLSGKISVVAVGVVHAPVHEYVPHVTRTTLFCAVICGPRPTA